jgi:hypothetical protein
MREPVDQGAVARSIESFERGRRAIDASTQHSGPAPFSR